jgi:hypothetical protein
MADRPAGQVSVTTMQVQQLLQLRELVQSSADWTLGHAQYLRTIAGGTPVSIMPFVFSKKSGAHVEGNYRDMESGGYFSIS